MLLPGFFGCHMERSPRVFVIGGSYFKECQIKRPQTFTNIFETVKIAGITTNKSPLVLPDN